MHNTQITEHNNSSCSYSRKNKQNTDKQTYLKCNWEIRRWVLCNGLIIYKAVWDKKNLLGKLFLSLIVFGGPEALFLFILLCHSSEDSLQWGTIPDGSLSKEWQSTVDWGDCQIWTRDCRFTVWCLYQGATTAPRSHHCSQENFDRRKFSLC